MKIIYFDDQKVSQLYPIILTRQASKISCGGYFLEELVAEIFSPKRIIREKSNHSFAWQWRVKEKTLLLNSRIIPKAKELFKIKRLIENGQFEGKAPLLNYSWEVILKSNQILGENLCFRSAYYQRKRNNVYVGKNAIFHSQTIFDITDGPIILGDSVRIAPFVSLKGPLYLGPKTQVKEFTFLSHCSVGSVCKLRGEIEECVIESYANKQHYGFIGHSYLGSWVNLGAGTTISDLKNTYGEIKADFQGASLASGMQFLGAVIGDYVKTAVNTVINSGKIIGPNSFLYGLVGESVPAFTNYYQGRKVEFYLTEAYKVQARMFKRRNLEQTSQDKRILRQAYLATRAERMRSAVVAGDFRL
ncbi:MAG: putative sugar nucleotidyl transferase [bacterium]|nr:putative sugar nucleotidyl transferase [bacterium]